MTMNILDCPDYNKALPQIWIEDEHYVIQSPDFNYRISTVPTKRPYSRKVLDPITVLFKLCRKMKSDAIQSTYT